MTIYICNKKIENSKLNEVKNLKGIGKAAWNFISAIYESGWDLLITDNNNISFRNKVLVKFTLKINKVNTNKSKSGKSTDRPTTFNKLPPSFQPNCPRRSMKLQNISKRTINLIEKMIKKNLMLRP